MCDFIALERRISPKNEGNAMDVEGGGVDGERVYLVPNRVPPTLMFQDLNL